MAGASARRQKTVAGSFGAPGLFVANDCRVKLEHWINRCPFRNHHFKKRISIAYANFKIAAGVKVFRSSVHAPDEMVHDTITWSITSWIKASVRSRNRISQHKLKRRPASRNCSDQWVKQPATNL
jgi:hypothetical protein